MDAYISRQPIFDVFGNVYAYKLNFLADESLKLKPAYEETNELFGADIERLSGEKPAFIHFSDDMLEYHLPLLFSYEKAAVEVSEKQLENAEALEFCRSLKERGYTIALKDCGRGDFALADIVEIDFQKGRDFAEETARCCIDAGKNILAVNVESRAEFDFAKELGCHYVCGGFYTKPEFDIKTGIRPLSASIVSALRIVSQQDAEIEELTAVLSRDSAVCQRLLRLINSVYFGFTTKISSINQAVVVLGMDYLREWIYLMAVQKMMQNDDVEAMKLSLLMAELCRKIAMFIPQAAKNPEAFYLMGLLSLIVFSGEEATEQALEEFPITTEIKKGLLRRGGLFGDVFEMAMSYNFAEWKNFEQIASKYNIDFKEIAKGYVECTDKVEKVDMNRG